MGGFTQPHLLLLITLTQLHASSTELQNHNLIYICLIVKHFVTMYYLDNIYYPLYQLVNYQLGVMSPVKWHLSGDNEEGVPEPQEIPLRCGCTVYNSFLAFITQTCTLYALLFFLRLTLYVEEPKNCKYLTLPTCQQLCNVTPPLFPKPFYY